MTCGFTELIAVLPISLPWFGPRRKRLRAPLQGCPGLRGSGLAGRIRAHFPLTRLEGGHYNCAIASWGFDCSPRADSLRQVRKTYISSRPPIFVEAEVSLSARGTFGGAGRKESRVPSHTTEIGRREWRFPREEQARPARRRGKLTTGLRHRTRRVPRRFAPRRVAHVGSSAPTATSPRRPTRSVPTAVTTADGPSWRWSGKSKET